MQVEENTQRITVGATPRAAIRAIVAEEAAKAGIGVGDLLGRRRARSVAAARHAAIRRVHAAFPGKSTLELGRIFGLHHTTILYAFGRDAADAAATAERPAPAAPRPGVGHAPPKPWTPAMTRFLVRMRRRGKTFTWIARALCVSRSVCVAQAMGRALATRPVGRPRMAAALRGDEPSAIGPLRDVVGAAACHWISGDAGDRDWRMCGHPAADGRPWCAHHLARVLRPAEGQDGV